jgi:hypothetical protein
MYYLSTLDKLKIIFFYQNEFPLQVNSRLEKIMTDKVIKSNINPLSAGHIQNQSTQTSFARMMIFELNIPEKEYLLDEFSLINKKKIDCFFNNHFVYFYCAKEYIESFHELLEKNYLNNQIIDNDNETNKSKIKL